VQSKISLNAIVSVRDFL